MEDVSSQQLRFRYNKANIITAWRDKSIFRTNIQENRYIFNKISQIQNMCNRWTILPTKPPTPDYIGDENKNL